MNNTQYAEALAEMRKEHADVQRALELLRSAHESGDHRATYALATWYLHGKEPVINRDVKTAMRLLTSAAAAGIPEALYDLAVFRETGEDGQPNLTAAFELYVKAALRGDIAAIHAVGRCYFYGLGIPKHRRVASIWIDRAFELGYVPDPERADDEDEHE